MNKKLYQPSNIKQVIEDIINMANYINNHELIKSKHDEESRHFLKDWKLLNSSVGGVFATTHEDDFLKNLGEVFYRLVKNHCFNNGNKRTALITMYIFLIWELEEKFNNTNITTIIKNYNLSEDFKMVLNIANFDINDKSLDNIAAFKEYIDLNINRIVNNNQRSHLNYFKRFSNTEDYIKYNEGKETLTIRQFVDVCLNEFNKRDDFKELIAKLAIN